MNKEKCCLYLSNLSRHSKYSYFNTLIFRSLTWLAFHFFNHLRITGICNILLFWTIHTGLKSQKEDYKIRKSVVLDPGTREVLLIFLSFNILVICHVFTSRSNTCWWPQTSNEPWPKTLPPGRKQLKNWTRITISSLKFLTTNSLFLNPTIS